MADTWLIGSAVDFCGYDPTTHHEFYASMTFTEKTAANGATTDIVISGSCGRGSNGVYSGGDGYWTSTAKFVQHFKVYVDDVLVGTSSDLTYNNVTAGVSINTWGIAKDSVTINIPVAGGTHKIAFQTNFWTPSAPEGAVYTFDNVKLHGGISEVSASNGSFGVGIPISIKRLATEAVHTLTVSCGGITKTLLTKSSSVSATWTPAVSEYAPKITTASSATATITCTTFIGGNSIGSSSKEITVSFKRDDVKPSCTVAVADTVKVGTQTLKAWCGKYVAGKSKLKITVTNTFKYGATIKSYSITANGKTYTANPATTDVVNTSYKTVTVKITDSRGITSDAVTVNLDIYAYTGPTLNVSKIYHSDANAEEQDSGNRIGVLASAAFTSLNSKNSVTITAAVKTASASSFTAAGTVRNGLATALSNTYSPDTTYDVKLTVTDTLGSSSSVTQRLASRKWAMKFRPNGNGVAFGKAAEYDNVLELPAGWRIKIGDQYWPS